MAFLIRNKRTGDFIDNNGEWTVIRTFAKRFNTPAEAQKFINDNMYDDGDPYMEVIKEMNKTLKESMYKECDKAIKARLVKLTEDLVDDVDKETWGDIDNSNLIQVDKPELEEDEPESAEDFIMKAQGIEVEEPKADEPSVLSEFDDLSNDEKKALLLKLAKNTNNLNAILADYLNKKIDEESTEDEKKYATWATEMGGGDAGDGD